MDASAGTAMNEPRARTSFVYYRALQGIHVEVHVFAGPDEQHRTHAGRLVFREAEFQDWRDRVEGPSHTFTKEKDR